MKLYYSLMLNFVAYKKSDVEDFLVFGVPNAKFFAFGTPDTNTIRVCLVRRF